MASSIELYRSSSVDLPEKKALIDVCKAEYKKKDGQTNNALWPNDTEPQLFIKFGVDPEEARNQIYFQNMTAGSKIIHIPELYWVFCDWGGTYMVMEYVQNHGGASIEEKGRALVELLSVRLPENAVPGPVGGGQLRHILFRHGIAGTAYNNNSDLEKFINKSIRCVDKKQKYKVNFEEDDLVPYYTDLYYDNFWKDGSNRVCVADFEHAGFAPSAFMAMVLRYSEHKELANVVLPHLERVNGVTQSILDGMNIALYVNQMGRVE